MLVCFKREYIMAEARYDVKIETLRENKLVGRKEVKLVVNHMGLGTLSRKELREKVADMFKVSKEKVFVRRIETLYGVGVSKVKVHIYYDEKRGLEIEPEHVIRKNKEVREEGKKEGGEKGGSESS